MDIKIIEPPLCDGDTKEFLRPLGVTVPAIYKDVRIAGLTGYESEAWDICHQCGRPIFGERCDRCGVRVKK